LRIGRFAAALLLALASAGRAAAQTSPFLPDPLFRDLANEISGDRAFEHVRRLSHYHRTGGSRDFFAAAEYLRQAAVEAGLEDVKLVRQKWNGQSWSGRSGSAWVLDPEPWKIAAYDEVALSVADNSRSTRVTAELVDVGAGAADGDYAGRDVKGRVVLVSGSATVAHAEAVWKRGALGVVSYQTNRPEHFDAPDQVAWGRIGYEAKDVAGVRDGTPGTFAIMISPRRARALQKRLAGGAPVRIRVEIETTFEEPAAQAYVEGWIRGSEISDQQIVLTAHIQEEKTSANDDGSGCASLLEIGRAAARLIQEGRPRPRRDIRFWWVNEFSSQEQFFRENQGEARRMLLNINQDMVGARQSLGGRVEYGSRLPWSLPHALDDVMESVLGMVRDANTALLTTRGTRLPQPFTREVTAVKGSREPYHARMVPYYNHTDHHAFTPAPVGVPATSLTNWPDEFIHSTGDDLEQLDATQIERNALVVAAVALYFASLRDEDAPALAAYVAARGAARLAGELATATAHLAQAAPAERPLAWREARNLVRQAYRKEAGALASVRRLAPRGRAADYVAQATARLDETLPGDLRALERAYTALFGAGLPNPELTREEQAMATQVFVPVAAYGAWLDAMDRLRPTDALHAMMRFETYNFADGRRTAWEVYESVAAEALSAGEWYYGRVRPADVLEALNKAVEAGAFTVKKAR
jgi:hypothetical protein